MLFKLDPIDALKLWPPRCPPQATAAVLVLVGAAMSQTVAAIDFSRAENAPPAFVTLVLIPLTCSITQGISLRLRAARDPRHPNRPRAARCITFWLLPLLSAGLLLLER